MSSKLVGYVKRIPFGERLATRKLALWAFCDSANDRGEGFESDVEAIMEVSEVGERSAKTIRSELRRAGILVREHVGGAGAGDRARYRLNVEIIEKLAAREILYAVLIGHHQKGATSAPLQSEAETTLKGEADCTHNDEGEAECTLKGEAKGAAESTLKGATKGEAKGEAKGATKGATAPTPLQKERGEGEVSFLSETYNLEPSPTPPYSPPSPSNGPTTAGPRWGNAVDALLAEAGPGRHVVEHLIAPLAATKSPSPRLTDPRQELRDIRDALAEFPAPALRLARQRLAAEWVRDFPHLKACRDACEQARVDAMHSAVPGSPEHAAWLAHHVQDPTKSAWARTVERNRWPLSCETQWPPASPSITPPQPPMQLWSIPARTPEWHAWLAHWRRQGRPEIAQAHEIAGRDLQTDDRWPPILTQTAA
ncbi:MAG: hypothetical protein ACOYLQ_09640 [Hyphomicrobiaceae bacterium]